MFEDRPAVVTFQASSWSGWDKDGYSIVTSAQLKVTKGMVLTPETLGFGKPDHEGLQCMFYEVTVERIVEDRVLFEYNNIVIKNPSGTINLSAPRSGRFILRPGESMQLATPTMDAGVSVSVRVSANGRSFLISAINLGIGKSIWTFESGAQDEIRKGRAVP
jgi:hypothetical protein